MLEHSAPTRRSYMTIQQNTPVAAAMGVFAFWARATLPSISVYESFGVSPGIRSMAEVPKAAFTGPPLAPRSTPQHTAGVRPAAVSLCPLADIGNSAIDRFLSGCSLYWVLR